MGTLWGTVIWFHCSASNRFSCLPWSNNEHMWNKEHSLDGAKTFSGVTISFLHYILILSPLNSTLWSVSYWLFLCEELFGGEKRFSLFLFCLDADVSLSIDIKMFPLTFMLVFFLLLFVWRYTTLSKAQTATLWPGVLRSFSIKTDKKEWWQLGNCRARPACHYW